MEKLTDVLSGSEFVPADYMPLVWASYFVTAAILLLCSWQSARGLRKATKALEKLQ